MFYGDEMSIEKEHKGPSPEIIYRAAVGKYITAHLGQINLHMRQAYSGQFSEYAAQKKGLYESLGTIAAAIDSTDMIKSQFPKAQTPIIYSFLTTLNNAIIGKGQVDKDFPKRSDGVGRDVIQECVILKRRENFPNLDKLERQTMQESMIKSSTAGKAIS